MPRVVAPPPTWAPDARLARPVTVVLVRVTRAGDARHASGVVLGAGAAVRAVGPGEKRGDVIIETSDGGRCEVRRDAVRAKP